MSKYNSLWEYVRDNGNSSLKMTFEQIKQIAGIPIDHSFLKYKKELAIMFDDPFEKAEEERLELEREELRQCEIRKARIALSMLQPLQREEFVVKLLPDLYDLDNEEVQENKLVKITDLQGDSFDNFIQGFNHNLIGHKYFKERLEYVLKNFRLLNRAEEQKVLSIFLYGKSGIGKTEVARLIANGLQDKCYLAKINFQNYSSQDSLNSLIGSPAGYVGCEHGELSDKIKKSKVGVLLCDEFEKTTRPVFSYFLELLEEGKFTDSMTREYDLDGYVIIFTSNLPNETEYKKVIPPELQTRFDLVCEFEEPTAAEKKDFLDLLLERAKSKYSEQFASITMTEDEKQKLYSFDYSSISALRDIKRLFNNRLMDYFAEKDVL